MSHKWINFYKRYIDSESPDQVALETYHSLQVYSCCTLFYKWISSRKHLVDVLRKESVVADAKLCNKAATLCEITKLAKKSQILGNVEEQEIIAGDFEFR